MKKRPILLLFVCLGVISCDNKFEIFSLNIQSYPENSGSIEVNPEKEIYSNGDNIELKAIPNEGYVFYKWEGDIDSEVNPYSLSINNDLTIIAHFEPRSYPLEINIIGKGSVSETLISSKTDYQHGSEVVLEATPESGWLFGGWSGDVNSLENPIVINVADSTNIEVTFKNIKENLVYEDVKINPFGRSPLTASTKVNLPISGKHRYRVLGDYEITSPWSSSNLVHTLEILGLYPNKENSVVIEFDIQGEIIRDTLNLVTDPLPSFFPSIEVDKVLTSQIEPGLNLIELSVGNAGSFNTYPLIFDVNGEVRGYLDFSDKERIVWPIKYHQNAFYSAYGKTIIKYDLMGNELNTIVINDIVIVHHDFEILPNGNFLLAVNMPNKTISKGGETLETIEDYIVEVDPNGSILNEWDMADHLDVTRTNILDGGHDWFHMNSIHYVESEDSFIVSGRNQGVVKISRNNELKWILSNHLDWDSSGRNQESSAKTDYLLKALDNSNIELPDSIQMGYKRTDEFDWTWGQHYPMVTRNGNLLIFDNGTNRQYGNSQSYSRIVEYQVDEVNKTIKQVWEFGEELGNEGFSDIISNPQELMNTGNRLFFAGAVNEINGARMVEVTYPNKSIVFDTKIIFKNQLSNGPPSWGQIDISYRGYRFDMFNGF